ncbi:MULTISPECIES: GntR family transcriptional regulator [Gordonia]|uniref:GntR family transcriptional regulator n=1 Tax=Gordonia TaxID=2053 RepID=UPI0039C87313
MMAPETQPKYVRVRTELEHVLADLEEGDSVPSERVLSERFSVARETVRQALQELLVEGRIERRGRGTVVSAPKMVQPLSLKSYTEGARQFGRVPSRIMVTFADAVPDESVCAGLGLAPGSTVMHLERVLLADGQKLGLESTFLPKERFGHFYETFDPETSLYTAIRAEGVTFASAEERIETALPSPRQAQLLETSTAMPMLLLRRRSFDAAGLPVEVVWSLFRGDRIAFEATLRE